MKQVIVEAFGGVENLKLVEVPTPQPGPGQVLIRLTSIGMNHADLMARRGQYRLSSGDPPFVPGIEGGGVIEAVGQGVDPNRIGRRVIVGVEAPRLSAGGLGGTYRTHYVCADEQAIEAPAALPDEQLGAVWLPYLTAWGCLVWKERLQPGRYVAMPAASSSVALAAAQIVRKLGAVPIGLTTSRDKVARMRQLKTCAFEHLIVTRGDDGGMAPWYKDIKRVTDGHGVDVFFDPVASGAYLDMEIRCLAQHGTVWVYGLLGQPGPVDVTPLIRKHAAVRGWALSELVAAGRQAFEPGYRFILDALAAGEFAQHVDRTFTLDEVRQAQEYMEQGRHVGKLVMTP